MNELLSVKNLSKSFQNRMVVKDISLSLHKGEVIGLLGKNGAGKSTTISCILGVENPDRGEIKLLGMQTKTKRKEIFEDVGVQFQSSSYQDKIKVGELCTEIKALYKHPLNIDGLLDDFGLSEFKNRFVRSLSGGEKQKLSVLLAMIPNPKLVFLDELTTGLDVHARRQIWNVLQKYKQNGLSILLTSHYMDEVEVLCDRIIILKDGVNIIEGSIEDIIKKSNQSNLSDAYLYFTDGGVL